MPARDATVSAQQLYWNGLYSSHPAPSHSSTSPLGWLEHLLEVARVELEGRILEVGCGRGNETQHLLGIGRTIISLDLSLVGLKRTAEVAPQAHLLQAALPDPLPFCAEVFDLIVAGLSLHYFSRRDTHAIIADLGRLLKAGKALAFQVNASGDTGSGYGKGDEIEPGVFAQQGRYKRFFTEEDCRELFRRGWQLEALQSHVENKYGTEKQTWIGIAVRTAND